MYANQNPERMLREAGEAEQLELLQATVHRAYEKTVFYRRRLEEYRVSPVEIEILADIKKLPFTTRSDLVKTSPLDFLTLPVKKTVRLRLQEKSNILRAGTEADVAHNIELTRRGLAAGGIKPGSVLAIVGGHPEGAVDDVQHAAESLGAAVVSLGGDFVRAVELIEQLGIDTVIGDPTRILQLIVTAQASGREMENLPLRACFCLNDAIQNPIGKYLRMRTGCEIFPLYVANDIGCTGMLYTCHERGGMHIAADFFYPEVVAFGQDSLVDDEQMGELVVTSLRLEAMPLLRYRTGQAVIMRRDCCPCGRSSPRFKAPFVQDK